MTAPYVADVFKRWIDSLVGLDAYDDQLREMAKRREELLRTQFTNHAAVLDAIVEDLKRRGRYDADAHRPAYLRLNTPTGQVACDCAASPTGYHVYTVQSDMPWPCVYCGEQAAS